MRSRYPPLDALLFFLVSARAQSFTKAAELLFVTRSAVSRRIKNLEDHLGVQLFHRHKTNLELTKAGLVYANALSQIFADLKVATDAVSEGTKGELRLTLNLSATFTTTWLSSRLSGLEECHPQLALAFLTNSIDTGVEPVDFEGGEMDAAILLGTGQWHGCHFEKLMDIYVQPVCAPSLLENGPLTDARQLADYNWLHYKHLPNLWQQWLTEAGVANLKTKKKDVVFDNVALATQAAMDGVGIIPMYRPLIDPKIEDGKLIPAHACLFRKEEAYYFICPKDYDQLPAVKLFRDWITLKAGEFQNS